MQKNIQILINIDNFYSYSLYSKNLNRLKNRDVGDILSACVDGLTGFPQAIEAAFLDTKIQQCIIHQIRNMTKFVSYKEFKPLMADLKRVYVTPTEEIALAELDVALMRNGAGNIPKSQNHGKGNWQIFQRILNILKRSAT